MDRSQPALAALPQQQAQAFVREGYIARQEQSGQKLSGSALDDIRSGKQDQSIGFDDATYALANAPQVWDAMQKVGHQT